MGVASVEFIDPREPVSVSQFFYHFPSLSIRVFICIVLFWGFCKEISYHGTLCSPPHIIQFYYVMLAFDTNIGRIPEVCKNILHPNYSKYSRSSQKAQNDCLHLKDAYV